MINDHVGWCAKVVDAPVRPPCIFGDVEGCIPPGTYESSDPFKVKFAKIANAPFVSHQWCFTHRTYCPLFEMESDFETAGLPCTDQSRAGKRLFEEGPTASVFCCHAKRHIELQTPVILLENVQVRVAKTFPGGSYLRHFTTVAIRQF